MVGKKIDKNMTQVYQLDKIIFYQNTVKQMSLSENY